MENLERKLDEIESLFHIFRKEDIEVLNYNIYETLKSIVGKKDLSSWENGQLNVKESATDSGHFTTEDIMNESLLLRVRVSIIGEKKDRLLNDDSQVLDTASSDMILTLELKKCYPEDEAIECISITASNPILQSEIPMMMKTLKEKAVENIGSESVFDLIVQVENMIRHNLNLHENEITKKKKEKQIQINFSNNKTTLSGTPEDSTSLFAHNDTDDFRLETPVEALNTQMKSSCSVSISTGDDKGLNSSDNNPSISKPTTAAKVQLDYAVIHIDHMNDSRNYLKLLKKWANKLALSARILYRNPDHNKIKNKSGGYRVEKIYVLLVGNADDIKKFLSQLRTEFVDIDAKGKKCKERNAKLLGQRSSPVLPKDQKTTSSTSFNMEDTQFTGFSGFEVEKPYNDENELESRLDSYNLLHFGVGKERFN